VTDSQALRAFKADFFKALAHPLRIQILDELRLGELGVSELRDRLDVELPNLSQQLAVLRGKGLVLVRKDGNNAFYRVADATIFTLLDDARQIFYTQLVGVRGMLASLSEP